MTDRLKQKKLNAGRRAHRVRSVVSGTPGRPRLAVSVSNLHITAQLIDDSASKTVVYTTTVGQKVAGTMTERAAWVGTELAKKAKKAKVAQVVFDRSNRKYHGRVKALADAARQEGLEF